MATPVKTVKVIDPRIEPEDGPVYATTITPTQQQFYTLPASGLSNSYVTFNNFTPLGPRRAIGSSPLLRYTFTIHFHLKNEMASGNRNCPRRGTWTIDSFPLNKCAEQIRVNVNGGSCFSSPLSYIRAKERYWDPKKIAKSFAAIAPTNRPWLANEAGFSMGQYGFTAAVIDQMPSRVCQLGVPDIDNKGYARYAMGPDGTDNCDWVPHYNYVTLAPGESSDMDIEVTLMEPIFCSPFTAKYDATYGPPLYNITSLDIAINLQDLGNMIRTYDESGIVGYSIDLKSMDLCYSVYTVPDSIPIPPVTYTPYRYIVPYITDYPSNPVPATASDWDDNIISITSGVYTMNEIPTAIWVFAGPTKGALQQNKADGWVDASYPVPVRPDWSFNKLALPMEHISISMANTTQILNTATKYDLYRIAKANGCQDSFPSWGGKELPLKIHEAGFTSGAGSFLRLIPGTDIILPDQQIFPGTNADNMVFQVEAQFQVPNSWPNNYRDIALWILFEYTGVVAIRPGSCDITMNPVSKALVNAAPVVSSAPNQEPSTMEGSGWLDTLKNIVGKAGKFVKDNKLISKALKFVPTVGDTLSATANALGFGASGVKRPRAGSVSGGAIMGMGDFC